MDPVAVGLGLAVTELVLKYGVPVAIDLLVLWKSQHEGEITEEKVKALVADLKTPESYFVHPLPEPIDQGPVITTDEVPGDSD